MKQMRVLLLLVAPAASTGCAVTNPIQAWQDRLTRYIAEQGNGDPAVLRETVDLRSRRSLRPARITFGESNIPCPGVWPFAGKRDANGVLLGEQHIGPHNWYFFLVGIIEHRPRSTSGPEDVRLVGFTVNRTTFRWRVAEPQPEALAQYLAASSASHPRVRPRGPYAPFPAPTDVFSLDVAGNVVTATEENSGARWALHLGEHVPTDDSRASVASQE